MTLRAVATAFTNGETITGTTSLATATAGTQVITDQTVAGAAREDVPTSAGIAYWNATAFRFDTTTGITTTATAMTVGATGTLNVSAGTLTLGTGQVAWASVSKVGAVPGDVGAAATSHAHGNITTDGKVGSTASLPLITTTDGAVTVGAFGTGATDFCVGNDSRLSDARTPTAHALTAAVHAETGLTTGHFLKATGATTFGFSAHGLTASDVGADATGSANAARDLCVLLAPASSTRNVIQPTDSN
jgi:hypothetical protein